ncbi:hypothetical protein G9P44_003213 [Scheffersomyces stipitis]|nr:hypothetical protein G9P44_003213 [Scheffersomyces stipitis]
MPERVLGSMVTYQDMPDESVIGTAGFWASPTDLARLSQFAWCCPRRIMQSEKFENREKFTFKNNNFFNSVVQRLLQASGIGYSNGEIVGVEQLAMLATTIVPRGELPPNSDGVGTRNPDFHPVSLSLPE